MGNLKYNRFITRDDVDNIVREHYPECTCPKCGKNGVCASSLETQFDKHRDEYVVLSFTVFCKDCAEMLERWDNTNRVYFGVERK